MLSLKAIFEAQAKYGINGSISTSETVPYDLYLAGCRRALGDKTPREYFNWDRKKQSEYTETLIISYVRNNLKEVEGYVSEDGQLRQSDLIERLKEDIVDFGVLKRALDDEDVQEIRILDKNTINVVRKGIPEPYVDSTGKPYKFISNEELRATLNRMIVAPDGNTPRMTVSDPLLNARTVQRGYRLSAVDSSAITPDNTVGYNFPVTTVTLRKHAAKRFKFEDYVSLETMTPKMAKFLKLCMETDCNITCVGETGSGKTTLLQTLAWELDEAKNVILIQNPTEIMLYDRDPATGRNRRSVSHWEAQDLDPKYKDFTTKNSMENLISHALRNSPDVIIPGEVRSSGEIQQTQRALQLGHQVMTSTHAFGAIGLSDRWGQELCANGGDRTGYIKTFVRYMNVVISMKEMKDGTKKILDISEYTGRFNKETELPEVNKLFEFKVTGREVDKDSGKVKKIHGYFQQCGVLSDVFKERCYMVGLTDEDLKDFLTIPLDGNRMEV